jgi:hypothetical protein
VKKIAIDEVHMVAKRFKLPEYKYIIASANAVADTFSVQR